MGEPKTAQSPTPAKPKVTTPRDEAITRAITRGVKRWVLGEFEKRDLRLRCLEAEVRC
jgi:hypothetical protein